MSKFDPFAWASKFIPEKYLHEIIRYTCISIFIYFLIHRILEYPHFYLKALWFVETIIYLVLGAAFWLRTIPVDRSQGIKEILIPLMGGVLPFSLLTTPLHPWIYKSEFKLLTIYWLMTLFTSITIWGMWTLKKSFSITVEARELVTKGPYQYIRHPVYFGEMMTSVCVMIWRFSWLNLGFLILIFAIQIYRSKLEEKKLIKNFPDYEKIMMKKWWFL